MVVSVNNFLKNYWRAVAWTVFYVFLMWCILHYLFNFNIFSIAHWTRLARIELHGFPGLVFGLLILAAVPIYVATTVLTMRNKSVPIKIPVPKCFAPIPNAVPVETPQPIVTEQEALPELRPGVPPEMREVFMRAQKNRGVRQQSVFNKPMNIRAMTGPDASVAEPVPVGGTDASVTDNVFPLPTDFDLDASADTDYGIPVFEDVDFGDGGATTELPDVPDAESPLENLCKFICDSGVVAHTADDLIIAGDFAIAVHDDDDFWVADEFDWFAAGRQKPSPIVALLNAKDANAKNPILYLGGKNIMDFDTLVEKWRADGITVVTNTDELLNLIKPVKE